MIINRVCWQVNPEVVELFTCDKIFELRLVTCMRRSGGANQTIRVRILATSHGHCTALLLPLQSREHTAEIPNMCRNHTSYRDLGRKCWCEGTELVGGRYDYGLGWFMRAAPLQSEDLRGTPIQARAMYYSNPSKSQGRRVWVAVIQIDFRDP